MRTIQVPSDFPTLLRVSRNRGRLSQLELALRAGTTQRHVSFLEQGRSKPGRDIILRLASSLNLSLRQRNALLESAGFAPAHPQLAPDSPDLAAIRNSLQHVLDGHCPYPAMVMVGDGEVIAANRSFNFLLDLVSPTLLDPPVNAMRIALHPDGMAPHIVNLDDWRRHILQGLRAREQEASLAALIDELEGYGTPADRVTNTDLMPFAVPLRLNTTHGEVRLIATIASFVTATDITLSDLRLEAFLPGDSESADILHRYDRRATDRDTVLSTTN